MKKKYKKMTMQKKRWMGKKFEKILKMSQKVIVNF